MWQHRRVGVRRFRRLFRGYPHEQAFAVTALDLARWAADAYGQFDAAAVHRVVTAVTGPGRLPDYVSARVDPFTGTVALPRPVGVGLARVLPDAAGSTAPVDEAARRVLPTRNALLVEAVPPAATAADGDLLVGAWRAAVADRVAHLADLATAAGAPAGLLQLADGSTPADAVLDPVVDLPVLVIIDDSATPDAVAEAGGGPSTVDAPAVVIATAGVADRLPGFAGHRVAGIEQAIR